MKNLFLTLILTTAFCNAQTAVYNKTKSAGNFKEYQTKEGQVLKIGDSLTIGYPLGKDFTFLTQGNQPVAAFLSNNKIKISNFKSVGSTNRGYKIYALFKGYGIPVYIDYESAVETGEVKNPFSL
ncbi:hypothetical protein B0A75_04555 [Flavobacterium oncorhynchi]|uniref:Uncharacterized protein n=1 Tax=Flavobacterium oncorhynchi TaxID=728056 RepID=A0A226I611_9FLAO|nr:hypothetical protein [Flavobacterium oncorhynchi]OXB01716.1 hypothetical protein B0A75_04555 [Flavobacterium oncorhynchi]